jgi:hypothetical protein
MSQSYDKICAVSLWSVLTIAYSTAFHDTINEFDTSYLLIDLINRIDEFPQALMDSVAPPPPQQVTDSNGHVQLLTVHSIYQN